MDPSYWGVLRPMLALGLIWGEKEYKQKQGQKFVRDKSDEVMYCRTPHMNALVSEVLCTERCCVLHLQGEDVLETEAAAERYHMGVKES